MAVTRRAVLKTVVAATIGAATGAGTYGFVYGRRELALTRTTVPVEGLPPSLAGLRLGFLSDIHRSLFVSQDDVATAVSMVMKEKPDLIVLGGDYVTWGDRNYIGPSAEALAPLSAPLGVFGILGNHDDDHAMPAALGKNGAQMLKDARTRITIRGETVDLIGIRFWTRRASDIASLVRGAAPMSILLAHDPRRLTEAAGLGVPLVLSGHTHGGQVVLPVVGAVAAQKFPVVAGVARRDRTTIFVSRGVGTVYVPVRINCPPEVAILTLMQPV
jgi:predicted MPP superfamily phosphohydrolase